MPPHSTGLAFDILYRYMTAEEQEHVMADIARLRDAGRVESLRENRDHFHVFAFVDGRRPDEELIAASLGHSSKAGGRKDSKKEPPKKSVKEASKKASKPAARREVARNAGSRTAGRKRR
ncbi:MAG: hypothetical protein ABW250_02320 [Pyrinomonadaceae bacterium]